VIAVTARLRTIQLDWLLGGLFMSSAAVQNIAEERPKLDLISLQPAPQVQEGIEPWDPHPLVPVLVAGAISLIASVAFVGSILAWLALRHSGVMAP
jgi:hypothetical protein